ncbi:MAG: class I SAM-dependent methyltransferase [Thermodesulfobacteriota bacterium]
MMTHHSTWQTDELSATFLQGVRGAIPAAALQLEVVGHIVQSWRAAPRGILDLGCGDGILGCSLLERFPEARATFADFSDPMLHAVRARIAGHERSVVVKADFSTPIWLAAVREHGPFDVVVSGFAIHHQPDPRKQELYAEVFDLLAPGGIFLNLEHVASATSAVTGLFDEYFIDHLHRFHQGQEPGRSRHEVAQTFYDRPDKKENILAPVVEQCQWLRRIGFVDVDCFFKIFELALFGGRKAEAGNDRHG